MFFAPVVDTTTASIICLKHAIFLKREGRRVSHKRLHNTIYILQQFVSSTLREWIPTGADCVFLSPQLVRLGFLMLMEGFSLDEVFEVWKTEIFALTGQQVDGCPG